MKPETELRILKALLFLMDCFDGALRALGVLTLLVIIYTWWNS